MSVTTNTGPDPGLNSNVTDPGERALNMGLRTTLVRWLARDGSEADADPTVSLTPGALEASNVNPSSELVKMISLSRQYEMQVRSIKTAEDDSDDSMKLLQTS